MGYYCQLFSAARNLHFIAHRIVLASAVQPRLNNYTYAAGEVECFLEVWWSENVSRDHARLKPRSVPFDFVKHCENTIKTVTKSFPMYKTILYSRRNTRRNLTFFICGSNVYTEQNKTSLTFKWTTLSTVYTLSLIHIWRCRRSYACRSRWSPYH